MMAVSSALIVALSVFTVQGAVLKNEEVHKRVARSYCDLCENKHGPPHPPGPPPPFGPPPPPFFHTHQWSGYARNGPQQGVFSGASAAAADGTEASGQAISISDAASSSRRNDGSLGQTRQDQTEFAYHNDGNNQVHQVNQQNAQSNSAAEAQAQESLGHGQSGHQGYAQRHPDAGLSKSNQQVGLLGNGSPRSSAQSNSISQSDGFAQSGFNSAAEAQAQGSLGHRQNDNQGSGQRYSGQDQHVELLGNGSPRSSAQSNSISQSDGFAQSGFNSAAEAQAQGSLGHRQNDHQGYGQRYSAQDQQVELLGNGSPRSSAQSNSISQSGGFRQAQGYSNHKGYESSQYQGGQQSYRQGEYGQDASISGQNRAYGQETAHSTLGGALGLAQQGLQTAQGSSTGCSTCSKSSYAISNAKSHSGSAVALSIGG